MLHFCPRFCIVFLWCFVFFSFLGRKKSETRVLFFSKQNEHWLVLLWPYFWLLSVSTSVEMLKKKRTLLVACLIHNCNLTLNQFNLSIRCKTKHWVYFTTFESLEVHMFIWLSTHLHIQRAAFACCAKVMWIKEAENSLWSSSLTYKHHRWLKLRSNCLSGCVRLYSLIIDKHGSINSLFFLLYI